MNRAEAGEVIADSKSSKRAGTKSKLKEHEVLVTIYSFFRFPSANVC